MALAPARESARNAASAAASSGRPWITWRSLMSARVKRGTSANLSGNATGASVVRRTLVGAVENGETRHPAVPRAQRSAPETAVVRQARILALGGADRCADGASWAVAWSGDDRLAPASAKVGDKRPPEPACEDQSRPNGSRRLALAHTCREWVRQISAGTTPVRSHRGKPNVSRSHCTTAASNYAGGSEGWSARMRSCAGVVQWQNIS